MLKEMKAFKKGAVALAVVALVACAQNQKVADEEKGSEPIDQQAASLDQQEPEQVQLVPEEEPKLAAVDYSAMNPVPIVFETLSVVLTEADMQVFEAVKDRVLEAERITVRGYCDRAQVENAKDVAIERGVAVRNELVRLGVNPKLIRIRYSTETADKHAAEFELHPGA